MIQGGARRLAGSIPGRPITAPCGATVVHPGAKGDYGLYQPRGRSVRWAGTVGLKPLQVPTLVQRGRRRSLLLRIDRNDMTRTRRRPLLRWRL